MGEPLLPARDAQRALVIFARMPECDGDLGQRAVMCERYSRVAVVEGAAVVADLEVGDFTAVWATPGEHFYAATFRHDGCTEVDCAAALPARVDAGGVYLVTFGWRQLSQKEVGYRGQGYGGPSGRTSFSVLGDADVLRYQKWMRTARRVEPSAGFVRGLSPDIVSLAKRRLDEDATRGERTPWLDATRAVAWDEPLRAIPSSARHRAEVAVLPDRPPFDATSARVALTSIDLSGCRVGEGPPFRGHARVIFNPDGRISKVVIDEPADLPMGVVECIGTTLGRAKVAPFRGSLVAMGTTWHMPHAPADGVPATQ